MPGLRQPISFPALLQFAKPTGGYGPRKDNIMEDYDEDLAAYMSDDSEPCDTGICPACNGSGEGEFDGAVCLTCRGRGEA